MKTSNQELTRNDLTTIYHLITGDRFYKANDKKKEVWEVVENDPKITKYQTYKFWAKRDKDKFPEPVKGDTPLIFLRHSDK